MGDEEKKVTPEDLRKDAKIWDEQSQELAKIATKTEATSMNRLESGIFQLVTGPYGQLVTMVSARCKEGSTATSEIAQALRRIAGNYERNEEGTSAEFRNI
ncbi:type VII secretion target [Kitasatospora sp. NPDC054939]